MGDRHRAQAIAYFDRDTGLVTALMRFAPDQTGLCVMMRN